MTFKLIHMVAKKEEVSLHLEAPCTEMRIRIAQSGFELLLSLIERVGGNSNWHQRMEYHNPVSLNLLKDHITDERAALYFFEKEEQIIGFSQTIIRENVYFSGGGGQCSVAEIYKIGLFPEYCHQGMGKFYVSKILEDLFKKYDLVYLNTRDTNVVNSVSFYQKLGFRVMAVEEKENDLFLASHTQTTQKSSTPPRRLLNNVA